MAKSEGILKVKLFDNKTVESLNQEIYEDYNLTKDNIQSLVEKAMFHMVDAQTTMAILPNIKGLLDTGVKNVSNMQQLIAINTKVTSDKDDSDNDIHSSIRNIIKERNEIKKERNVA